MRYACTSPFIARQACIKELMLLVLFLCKNFFTHFPEVNNVCSGSVHTSYSATKLRYLGITMMMCSQCRLHCSADLSHLLPQSMALETRRMNAQNHSRVQPTMLNYWPILTHGFYLPNMRAIATCSGQCRELLTYPSYFEQDTIL